MSVINSLLVKGPAMNPNNLIVIGVSAPTQWSKHDWPYLAKPNSQRAKAVASVTLPASCPDVWGKIGGFGSLAAWHPGIDRLNVGGKGIGAIRAVFLKNGKLIVEQLNSVDVKNQQYTYSMLSGPLPLTDYQGKLKAESSGNGCKIVWSSTFTAVGAPRQAVVEALSKIYSAGLTNLKKMARQ